MAQKQNKRKKYLFNVELPEELATLHQGIPAGGNKEDAKIGMDTHNRKEGIHLWIGEKIPIKTGSKKKYFHQISVHLTREDAYNLIREIEERIF